MYIEVHGKILLMVFSPIKVLGFNATKNVTKILVDLEFNEGEIQFHNLEKAHI